MTDEHAKQKAIDCMSYIKKEFGECTYSDYDEEEKKYSWNFTCSDQTCQVYVDSSKSENVISFNNNVDNLFETKDLSTDVDSYYTQEKKQEIVDKLIKQLPSYGIDIGENYKEKFIYLDQVEFTIDDFNGCSEKSIYINFNKDFLISSYTVFEEQYKEICSVDIISEQEAYEKILEGDFRECFSENLKLKVLN